MASILQILVLQIIVGTSLCNDRPCTGMSCPDGLSLVPINNLSDSEGLTSDSNETVQVVCYNEMGEPQGCLPNYDDTKLFQIVLKVACSLSIVDDGFVIISLCLFRTILHFFSCAKNQRVSGQLWIRSNSGNYRVHKRAVLQCSSVATFFPVVTIHAHVSHNIRYRLFLL